MYTLRQLFGQELTIVIPDMQRDYCWGNGDASTGQKVSPFVNALVHMYRTGVDAILGLLYGYEYPAGSNHLLIIDGQQRLTTLYLLIGMLYRRTPRRDLRQLLISDYELLDDGEPRLLYQVRSQAMYFMSDLVIHFFLDRDGRLSQLERSPWFYDEYSTDTTIQSFIGAIRHIDEVLEAAATDPGWDFDSFADYVADRLMFIYHDLDVRHRAEGMFVTINTTVLPLTQPQVYRTRLMGAAGSEAVERWEQMERWAWQNRPRDNGGHTSDYRMQQVLELWSADRGDGPTAPEPDRFDDLYRFFTALRTVTAVEPSLIEQMSTRADYLFVLLPTIQYVTRWNMTERDSRQIARMVEFLRNITRYYKQSQSGSDTAYAKRIVSRMPERDLTSLLQLRADAHDKILNDEELCKLRCLAQSGSQRERLEAVLARGQAHPMLNGRVQQPIQWSTDRQTGQTDIPMLERYIDGIYRLWGDDIDCAAGLDTLRRALLTLRQGEYPIVRRGDTNLSLCWNYYDWQRLMVNNPAIVRRIVERAAWTDDPQATMETMTDRFADTSYPYYFLIKDARQMRRCMHRSLMRPSKPYIGYHRDNTDGRGDVCWHVDQRPLQINRDEWTDIRMYGAKCLYTDHRTANVAIDIYYTPGQSMPYRMEVFARKNVDRGVKRPYDVPQLLDRVDTRFKFDKRKGRFCATLPNAAAVADTFNRLTQRPL